VPSGFSLVLTKNPAVARAIASIAEDAWTPVHYPGAVTDPDTGQLISDAAVAEVPFTAFASTKTPFTARLIVRGVRDRARTDELFPETVHSDLIDGPAAHLPSSRFAANSAWAICAAICHNLLPAAGPLIMAGGLVAAFHRVLQCSAPGQ
jgi:hypothetical protein